MSELPLDISVVIPCFNESTNVGPIAAAVKAELERARVTHEIIFIDNASNDDTVARIKVLCGEDKAVKLIANNRNYGQMRSPTYGIYQASGRAVIAMCADFQDPPALIGEFINHWRAGTLIVLGTRRSEASSLILRAMRAVGYGFLARFADYRVIPGATGFGLFDRKVVDCLARWREPEPFFRGMLVESGYSLVTIHYDRPDRAGGTSKNNLGTLVSFALSGLASSSKRLLRLPLYISVGLGLLGLTVAAAALLAGLLGWHGAGVLLLLSAIELHVALVLFFLGLLGEQVRLISERTRETPLVIEEARINF